MILKSVLMGLLCVAFALVLTACVMIAVVFAIGLLSPAAPDGYATGWDPISLTRPNMYWAIPIVAFIAGFLWQYRKPGR
ncbi:MAG TPA: hypothetical protein VLA96_03165 [Terriglobales bacterium]|nr:hypothetical protein [Terriglobales bacterium]